MVDIQSAMADIKRGKKRRKTQEEEEEEEEEEVVEEEEETTGQKYNGLPYSVVRP